MTKREELVSWLVERRYGGGRSSPPGPNGRRRIPVPCLLLAIVAMLMLTRTLEGQVYVDSNFRGTTADGWTMLKGPERGVPPVPNLGASLTANGGPDSDGDGWLRLTEDNSWQSSFVYFSGDNAAQGILGGKLPTKNGLKFEFDFVIYSGTSAVADGFALVIFDAAVDPAAGAYGGSLGYAQHNSTPGLEGGILGIGFDEFGNFSNFDEGRQGGRTETRNEKTVNAIAIRGPQTPAVEGHGAYHYLTGTNANVTPNFSTGSASTRAAATVHSVEITLTPDKKITVKLKPDGGEWFTPINAWQCTLECPSHVRFGFTGSTGSVTGIHEIRNLQVSAVPEPGALALMVLGGVVGAGMYWRQRRFTTKSKAA